MGSRKFLGQLRGETGEATTKEKVPDVAHPIQIMQEQLRPEARTPSRRTPEHLRTPEEDVLETREQSGRKELGGGCNKTEFVSLKDDGAGVFKPKSGEDPDLRDNILCGTYYLRERAAYLIDRFIGFGLVPPTTIRVVDGEVGSLQQFIPDAPPYLFVLWEDVMRSLRDELKKLWIFDHLIYSSDRKGDNLLKKGGRLYAIDNGLSLGESNYLRFDLPYEYKDGYLDFYDVRIGQDIIDRVQALARDDNNKAILRDLLFELLSAEEVDAFFTRLDRIAKMLKKGYIAESEEREFTRFD